MKTTYKEGKIVLCIVFICIFACGGIGAEQEYQSFDYLSPIYNIDKIYKSMQGPDSSQDIYLTKTKEPELLWITSSRTEIVGTDGTSRMPQEFMCHMNLDFSKIDKHNLSFPNNIVRIVTLSQGQFEVNFPKGFGLPMLSNEPLNLTTQVLNLNHENEVFQVRHHVTINFVRDRDLKGPMKALFTTDIFGLKLVEGRDPYYEVQQVDKSKHGPGCLIGRGASNDFYEDSQGRKFTGHWVVNPGREVNRTLVTKLLNLPYDTTVHYIAVHLHPFAESLELRDLTTGQSLFKSQTENYKDRVGLVRVDTYSSEEGFPVYKDHEYELVSVYNNTTPVDQDSMAVMYMFLLDKNFKKPDLSKTVE